MAILNRITGMLLRPQAEWDAVAHEAPGTEVLLRNYLLPLCLLAPVATMVGMLAFDTKWNAQYGYSALRDRAPVIALATYGFQIISVYLLAVVLYFLARTERRSPSFLVALQVAVLAHHFGVMQVHNLRETMEKKGVVFERECLIFEVCQPQQAKKVLEQNMKVSTALPCRISIYEQGGKTTLATLKPTTLLALFDTPQLANVAGEVEETIVKIMKAAASS